MRAWGQSNRHPATDAILSSDDPHNIAAVLAAALPIADGVNRPENDIPKLLSPLREPYR